MTFSSRLQLFITISAILAVICAFSSSSNQVSATRTGYDNLLRSGIQKAKKDDPSRMLSFAANPVQTIASMQISLQELADHEQSVDDLIKKHLPSSTYSTLRQQDAVGADQQQPASPPECIQAPGKSGFSGNLSSGNLFNFPFGYFSDYGKYAQCQEIENKKWCLAEISMKCVNSHLNASYDYPHHMHCNGVSNVNGIGACYDTELCPTQKALDDQFAKWSFDIRNYTSSNFMIICWGLELIYRYGTEAKAAKFFEECDPVFSYVQIKTWCDTADPVPSYYHDDPSTLAVLYTFLTIVCFAALATLVGILRRTIAGWREDFNDDDGIVNITLASQEGRSNNNRSQNRDTLSLLDRLLYGEAELQTSAQDAAQMQQASVTYATNNNSDDLYVSQLKANDPDAAFRQTIGAAAERERNSGVFDLNYGSSAYDPLNTRNSSNGDSACCSSCCGDCSCSCCSTDSCWRAFSSGVVAWFDAFDVLSGLKDLLTPLHSKLPTAFFDGLRSIAMLLVVAGHTAFFPNSVGEFSNKEDLKNFILSYQSVTLFPALLAVDTFFYLSGFLSMFLMSKQFEKFYTKRRQTGRGNPSCSSAITGSLSLIILAYVNRYLRLTPTLIIVAVLIGYVIPLTIDGPLARIFTENGQDEGCRNYLWSIATYWYSMYFADATGDGMSKTCNAVSWYIALDCIYFLFVPVIAAIDSALREHRFGLRYVMPTIIFLATCGFYAVSIHQHPIAGVFHNANGQALIGYYRAIDRVPPFIIGSLTALLNNLPAVHDFFKDSKKACWIAYIFSLGLALAIWNYTWRIMSRFYALGPDSNTDAENYGMHSLYFLWGVPHSLITLTALAGYKSWFTQLLSHPFFGVLSKLTYGMYLLHPTVILYFSAEDYDFYSFQRFKYYVNIGGVFVMTVIGATILFVFVDRPVGMFCSWLSGVFGVKKGKRF